MKSFTTEIMQAVTDAGFAQFNDVPHHCVEVPDGNSTITVKTSDGRRITFAFMFYKTGEAPQCVDIQFHDTAHRCPGNDGPEQHPAQNVIAFKLGADVFNTRKLAPADRPMFTTILMHD